MLFFVVESEAFTKVEHSLWSVQQQMASMQVVAHPGAVSGAPPAVWMNKPLGPPVPPPAQVGVETLAKVNDAPRGVCRYFLVGQCRYGDACWLVHPGGSSTPSPGAVVAGQPRPGPAKSVPIAERKTVACRYFQLGQCKFGDQCHYKHERIVAPEAKTDSS